jgi:hypothetical protein
MTINLAHPFSLAGETAPVTGVVLPVDGGVSIGF